MLDTLRAMLPALRREYGLGQVWLVGSHSRQRATLESDLDLVVTFTHESPSLLRYADLTLRLEDKLGVPVDLVHRDAIRPEMAEELMRDAVPL